MNDSLIYSLGFIIVILVLFLFALTYSKIIPNGKKKELLAQLHEIKQRMNENNPFILRDSIVRLDSILAKSFNLRYGNDLSCSENLKKHKRNFKRRLYEDVWQYHKLRNNIVHENVDVRKDTARKAFRVYCDAINKVLGF